MIILDTSGLLSALFPDQRHHEACARVIREAKEPMAMSPFVLAELDCLIAKYSDVDTDLAFLEEIEKRAYTLANFTADEVAESAWYVDKYRSLDIGLADASILVLADRYMTRDVLTLDERHFRVVRPHTAGRKPLRILPADL